MFNNKHKAIVDVHCCGLRRLWQGRTWLRWVRASPLLTRESSAVLALLSSVALGLQLPAKTRLLEHDATVTSAKDSLLFPPNVGSRAGALCSRAGTRLRLVQTRLVALVNRRRNTPVFLFVVFFISAGVWCGMKRSDWRSGVCLGLFVYFYHRLSVYLSVGILD